MPPIPIRFSDRVSPGLSVAGFDHDPTHPALNPAASNSVEGCMKHGSIVRTGEARQRVPAAADDRPGRPDSTPFETCGEGGTGWPTRLTVGNGQAHRVRLPPGCAAGDPWRKREPPAALPLPPRGRHPSGPGTPLPCRIADAQPLGEPASRSDVLKDRNGSGGGDPKESRLEQIKQTGCGAAAELEHDRAAGEHRQSTHDAIPLH